MNSFVRILFREMGRRNTQETYMTRVSKAVASEALFSFILSMVMVLIVIAVIAYIAIVVVTKI